MDSNKKENNGHQPSGVLGSRCALCGRPWEEWLMISCDYGG